MTDLISRQAAIETVNRMADRIDTGDIIDYRDVLVECFKVLPSAQKHGKWEPHPKEADWDVCTACGCGTMRRTHGYHNGAFWDAEESYAYCPWCGARMEQE